MNNDNQIVEKTAAESVLESVIIQGDLSKLTSKERVEYYNAVCKSIGLNPLTKPFDYLTLKGKMILYARKDCAEQLRSLKGISIEIKARESVDDCYVVTARAIDRDGRVDESMGAVNIAGLRGEDKANAILKCETKAKRRVTLSICGLGMLDESEISSMPAEDKVVKPQFNNVDKETGECLVENVLPKNPDAAQHFVVWEHKDERLHRLNRLIEKSSDPKKTEQYIKQKSNVEMIQFLSIENINHWIEVLSKKVEN